MDRMDESRMLEECCVCGDETLTLDCGHGLCGFCLDNLRNKKCPMCRSTLSGQLVTKKVLTKINKKIKEDRKKAEEDDHLQAIYLMITDFLETGVL